MNFEYWLYYSALNKSLRSHQSPTPTPSQDLASQKIWALSNRFIRFLTATWLTAISPRYELRNTAVRWFVVGPLEINNGPRPTALTPLWDIKRPRLAWCLWRDRKLYVRRGRSYILTVLAAVIAPLSPNIKADPSVHSRVSAGTLADVTGWPPMSLTRRSVYSPACIHTPTESPASVKLNRWHKLDIRSLRRPSEVTTQDYLEQPQQSRNFSHLCVHIAFITGVIASHLWQELYYLEFVGIVVSYWIQAIRSVNYSRQEAQLPQK